MHLDDALAPRVQIHAYESAMDKGLEAERDGHWFKAVSAFSSVLDTLNAMVPAPTRLQATALAHRCV